MSIANFYFFNNFLFSEKELAKMGETPVITSKVEREVKKFERENRLSGNFVFLDRYLRVAKNCEAIPLEVGKTVYSFSDSSFAALVSLALYGKTLVNIELNGSTLLLTATRVEYGYFLYFEGKTENSQGGSVTNEAHPVYPIKSIGNFESSIDGGLVNSSASELLQRIFSTCETLRYSAKRSYSVSSSGLPEIRFSPKDFCRIAVRFISACIFLANGKDISVDSYIEGKNLMLAIVFRSGLPAWLKKSLDSGNYLENVKSHTEYSELFRTLVYLKRLCNVYGYTLGFDVKSGVTKAYIAFPVIEAADGIKTEELVTKNWLDRLVCEYIEE